MPAYIQGPYGPRVTHDEGSGVWCSEPSTYEVLAYKQAIMLSLDTAYVETRTGPTAIAHMRHYFGNTGKPLVLDMPAMLAKSEQLRENMEGELAQAKAFVETLGLGVHVITSSALGGGIFSGDLGYAIGSYCFWGRGMAIVVETTPGARRLTLHFEFHFYDRYNWDSGKSIPVGSHTVEDTFMQKFHRQCYAREFDIHGMAQRRVEWDLAAPPPRRQRKTDNPFEFLLE